MTSGYPGRMWLNGARAAHSAERAAFGMLSSFAITVVASRAVNYGRERARPAPAVRSVLRRAREAGRPNRARVHHFVPGLGIGLLTGAAAILTRDDALGLALSLPFGTGAALTLDEFALLVEHDNPYWGTERFAALLAAASGAAALALAARFAARGRVTPPGGG